MGLLRIAARNLLRNKFRTTATLLGSAIAVLAFLALRTVLWAWNLGVESASQDRLATRNKVALVYPLPKKYVQMIKDSVPGVTAITYMNWFGGKDPQRRVEFFASLAVDPPTAVEVFDEMVLSPEQQAAWFADRQGAVLGDVLARQLGVKIGDKVTLTGTIYPGDWTFNVSGIYSAARKSLDRSQFMFHYDYLNESLPEARRDKVGWIATRIAGAGQSGEISQAIDRLFDEKDQQTTTMSERAMNMSFMGMISAILTALNIVSLIIMGIMMMILGNTLAMGVRERTHEYGVLRAVGFMPKHIAWLVIGEAAVIGLLAGGLGVAISYPIVELGMGRWLEENMGAFFPYFRLQPVTAGIAVALAMGLSIVASLLPAIRASRLRVTDALRRVA